jgi:hypothetical protein
MRISVQTDIATLGTYVPVPGVGRREALAKALAPSGAGLHAVPDVGKNRGRLSLAGTASSRSGAHDRRIAKRATFVKRTNSHKFILHEEVWRAPGVLDVTEELRAVAF